MSLYRTYVLPRLIHRAMQNRHAAAERARFVPCASGTVLEVGIGSGLNIPFYSPDLDTLVGLDPSVALWKLGRQRTAAAPFPIAYIGGSGEHIPLEDQRCDTVVTTWTLCTIPDPVMALTEMRRVLKPDGRLIFVEHGLAPDRRVQTWQHRLNPLWHRLAGGCTLDRRIDTLIANAGFHIVQLDTGYLHGPKPFSFLYKGLARPMDITAGQPPTGPRCTQEQVPSLSSRR
jgi:ubiquinone/menaquinone biosynthesis C-methylase UbiE